jgi:signal transduction histidine kinase
VRELRRLARSSAKRIALTFAVPDDPAVVVGDETQLRQVVLNLVINASEAMAGRPGEIAVVVRRAEVEPEAAGATTRGLAPGPYVVLEVGDRGCGMDPATQARIFEPFFSTKREGRGLGLSVVYGIVRDHAGTLRIDSAPGEGTTFQIYLPARPARRPARPSRARWRRRGGARAGSCSSTMSPRSAARPSACSSGSASRWCAPTAAPRRSSCSAPAPPRSRWS